MDTDAILSFSAPLQQRPHVDVQAAPVLELTYAYYYLLKRIEDGRDNNLAWVRQLRSDPPPWLVGLRDVWRSRGVECLGFELFVLAGGLGYAVESSPERFLRDLPQLPARLLPRLPSIAPDEDDTEDGRRRSSELRARLELLADEEAGYELQDRLASLWGYLEPAWEREGRAAAEGAAAALSAELAGNGGDLLAALPRHHFSQFEAAASDLRERQHEGPVLVTPLFFASVGGFNLHLGGTVYLGYGVHSESLFHEQAQELGRLSARVKAFADPTRLQLFTLLARFSDFTLTVGDLARQLGVSQPTVSGHLKILREAGVLTLERRGNRSYYHADPAAVRELLRSLEAAVLD